MNFDAANKTVCRQLFFRTTRFQLTRLLLVLNDELTVQLVRGWTYIFRAEWTSRRIHSLGRENFLEIEMREIDVFAIRRAVESILRSILTNIR